MRPTAVLVLGFMLVTVVVACGGTQPLPDIDATVEARIELAKAISTIPVPAPTHKPDLPIATAEPSPTSTSVPPTPTPTPDIEATVQARLAEERAIEATVEAKAQTLAKAMVEATAQAASTFTPIPTQTPTPTATTVPPTATQVPPTPVPTFTPTATPVPPTPTSTPVPIRYGTATWTGITQTVKAFTYFSIPSGTPSATSYSLDAPGYDTISPGLTPIPLPPVVTISGNTYNVVVFSPTAGTFALLAEVQAGSTVSATFTY